MLSEPLGLADSPQGLAGFASFLVVAWRDCKFFLMASPILVTGGGGFIGSHLVRRLVEHGERVRVLEQPKAAVSHLPLDRVELEWADIRDRTAVARAVRSCREIYHLAANPQLWAPQRGLFREVNFLGAMNVIDEGLQAGVRRIVHTGSETILALQPPARPGEARRVQLRYVVGPYSRAKFFAEQHAMRLARNGAPVVVVSPTLPVGPGDYSRSPPTQMIVDFCRGGRREYVDAELNLIDVRDIADGMVLAMAKGVPARRYLLGNQTLSLRGLFAVLARMTGLPEPDRRIPYPLALAVAYVSEWIAAVITRRSPAATVAGVRLTRRRQPVDIRPCLDELGLTPRPLEESLRDALAWYRVMGWISRS
jgi:dihydroflavonol-4-reductase